MGAFGSGLQIKNGRDSQENYGVFFKVKLTNPKHFDNKGPFEADLLAKKTYCGKYWGNLFGLL